MDELFHHEIIDGCVAYWVFYEDATVDTFMSAFEVFNEVIHRPEIDRLVVEMKMIDTFLGRGIQDLWLQTGEIAEKAKIVKWGVVAPVQRQPTLRFLVSGGNDGPRSYEHFLSASRDEVLAWAAEPLAATAATA